MNLSTLRNPVAITNVTPPALGEGLSDTARNEARFASLLRQNQAAAAQANAVPPTPHAEPAPRPGHGEAHSRPEVRPSANGAPHQMPPAAPHAKAADEPDTQGERATQHARKERVTADGDAGPESRASRADDKPAATPPAAHAGTGATPAPIDANPWLAALQLARHAPVEPDAQAAGAAHDATASGGDASGPASSTARARSERAATLKADAQDEAARADPRASLEADSKDARFAATLAESRGLAKAGAPAATPTEGTRPAGSLPSVASAVPTAATTADPIAASSPLQLATPVDSPDFARTLGVQISVLAKDGVQRAELHLNPAEMGPVSVHIVMDGTQARIDFGADHAATRQAIETGLPELASALRDAGFTLAGGGVSQHAHGREDGGEGRRTNALQRTGGPAGGSDATASARPIRHTVRDGGVDLYA